MSVTAEAERDAAPAIPLKTARKKRSRPKPVTWPELVQLRLSAEDAAFRREGIGGSDANIILSGEPDRVIRLWQEKRGEVEPENLSAVLQVMLGSWTEAFNRQWYEQETGELVSAVGVPVVSPEHGWR